VLRRIAGDLFWTARYLERAQWRARLVDVNYHLLLEVPPRDTDPWEPLVQITGEAELFGASYSRADEASVVNFFAFDRESPSSIRRCVELARGSLSPLRHLISSELWLEVSRLYLDSRSWSPETLVGAGVSPFFTDLRDRFYTITGIIQSTLPRDLAYDFIQAGTMVERADSVARLLDVKYHYLLPRLDDLGGPRTCGNGRRCCAARRRWKRSASFTAIRCRSIAWPRSCCSIPRSRGRRDFVRNRWRRRWRESPAKGSPRPRRPGSRATICSKSCAAVRRRRRLRAASTVS
jgi:A predicted alpha-helical domain with a conserved ER motif.